MSSNGYNLGKMKTGKFPTKRNRVAMLRVMVELREFSGLVGGFLILAMIVLASAWDHHGITSRRLGPHNASVRIEQVGQRS